MGRQILISRDREREKGEEENGGERNRTDIKLFVGIKYLQALLGCYDA